MEYEITASKISEIESPSWVFLLSVLLLYSLPQIAVDIYLPSWPAMVTQLHATKSLLQLSLTAYLLALGLSQLIYGFYSDKYGRKPTLLIGMTVFIVSSFCCTFSTSAEQLIFFRIFQGLGIGCAFTIASAILADVFSGSKLAKMTTYSAIIYSLSLVFAPILGGYLQHYFNWKANFLAMALYGCLIFLFVCFYVRETNRNFNPIALSLKNIFLAYLRLVKNRRIISNVLCLTSVYGIMIAFNVVGPFLLQDDFKINEIYYGSLLFYVGSAYLAGTLINSIFLKKIKLNSMILLGLVIIAISSFILLIFSFCTFISLTYIILFIALAMLGVGFVFPNCFALALDSSPQKGVSSAFIGSFGLIGTAIISAVIANFHIQHQLCLSLSFLFLVSLGFLSFLFSKNK